MYSRRLLGCVGLIVSALAVASIGATTPKRTTYFTFNTPVRLPNQVLPPGTYVFELATPETASNVVRVMDRDRSRVYLTAVTQLVERPHSRKLDATLIFGERAKGTPPPVRVWYPDGERLGREFIY